MVQVGIHIAVRNPVQVYYGYNTKPGVPQLSLNPTSHRLPYGGSYHLHYFRSTDLV